MFKVAQIAAYTLGLDLEMISVKPSISLTTPNSTVTGGSMTSDTCGYVSSIRGLYFDLFN
jgi:xanthine dehydrogenase/oxidase